MLADFSLLLWAPMVFAIVSLFFNQSKVAFSLMAITLISAFAIGRIDFVAIGYILVGFGIAYKAPKLEGLLKSISYGFLVVWFSAFWWWDDVDGFRCTCRNWVWYGFSLNWAALGYGSVTFLV